jgi:CDP-glucose 4,6-dehydratase
MGEMVMNDALLSVYSGKRVLVTGHTGFKGSWLCVALKELGADVLGYALAPDQENSHFSALKLERLVHHVEGDILDAPKLSQVVNEFQPEFVFHLAAQALVRLSYEQPKLTFDTNVAGSVNVLESIRSCAAVKSVIYVTSDKCYLNREWEWGYRENDRLGGRDPYSASKAAAELVFSAYLESYFNQRPNFGAASVRAGNVIGGGDWAKDRIVPDCIRSLIRKEPILLRHPGSTRPWQHVLEPLSGYLLLAARLYEDPKRFTGAWNFGPENRDIRTVKDLTERIIAEWGDGRLEIGQSDPDYHEARLLHLNCDKAIQELGWRPRWDFDRTVRETADWYRSSVNGEPAIDVSRRQIRSYMEASHD